MKNKILTILLSLFVGFGLWLYVVTVEHTQIEMTYYNIPVNWDGEDVLENKDLRLEDREMTISMKLYGNRSVLNKLKSSDIIVLADLRHISEAGEKHLNYTVSYSGVVDNSIEIVDKPASINVKVARWMDKTIPVTVQTSGKLGDTAESDKNQGIHYVIDTNGVTSELKTVDISGPYEQVDSVKEAKIFVDMTGKTDSYEQRMTMSLCDAKGNPIPNVSSIYVSDGGSTLVTVPLLAEKEVALSIFAEGDGVLTQGDVDIKITPAKIKVRGSLEDIRDYGAAYVLPEIKLKDEKTEYTFTVLLPGDLECDVNQVKVEITYPDREQTEIKVPAANIVWGSLAPDSALFEWQMPDDLVVTLYHKKSDEIKAEDVMIKVIYTETPAENGYRYEITLKNNVPYRDLNANKWIQIEVKPIPMMEEPMSTETEFGELGA